MTVFKTGQRVAFSRSFLRSTGQIAGDVPFLRGVVESCQPIGQRQLCYIRWQGIETLQGVLSSNLVLVDRMHLEPA